MLLGLPAYAAPAQSQGKFRRSIKAVPNQYIVVLDENVIDAPLSELRDHLISKFGGTVLATFGSMITGFAIEAPEGIAQALSMDPRVKFVEENAVIEIAAYGWGNDRVDERLNPRLDYTYDADSTGKGVYAYVLDTGIWNLHSEFSNPDMSTGVARPRVMAGFDALNVWGTSETIDPVGRCGANSYGGSHGTGVASALGGNTVGTAKDVILRPVMVASCGGSGDTVAVIRGIEWAGKPYNPSGYSPYDKGDGVYVANSPRLINMSFATPPNSSLDTTVASAIAKGFTVVVVAGNKSENLRDEQGNLRYAVVGVPGVIVVGGSAGKNPTDQDRRWTVGNAENPGSNYGVDVDVFAPAQDVVVAFTSGADQYRDTPAKLNFGTSFAAPLVAGVAARWLSLYAAYTPQQVHDLIIQDATTTWHGLNIIDRETSPNRMIYKGRATKPRI